MIYPCHAKVSVGTETFGMTATIFQVAAVNPLCGLLESIIVEFLSTFIELKNILDDPESKLDGTRDHRNIMTIIIITRLWNGSQFYFVARYQMDAHNGCKLSIPHFPTIAPIANGRIALPDCPMPTMKLMEAVTNHSGMIFLE